MTYEEMEYDGFLQFLWDKTHTYDEEDMELPWFTTEKDIRKACELPVTKNLLFYGARHDDPVFVKRYRPAPSGVFQIVCEDDSVYFVNRDYFRHMQKPSFLKDMKEEDEAL